MTSRTPAIKRAQVDIERYTQLLQADWNDETLGQTLSLMREVLARSGVRIIFPWEDEASARRSYPIPATASEDLREFLDRLNAPELPPLPARLPSRVALPKAALAHRTQAMVFLLTLQSTGETGFWLDLQSLLFLMATHVHLDALLHERMGEEAAYLAHALSYHARNFWAHRPDHQHFLFAQLAEAIGAEPLARQSLMVAFALVSPDDHDYITKAQAVWLHLMEHRDYASAKRFILDVIRRSREAQLAELEVMLDETYAEGRAA